MLKRQSVALALGCCLLLVSSAYGLGPVRCDGRLIERGVSAAYVLSQCGEPVSLLTRSGPIRSAIPGGFSRLSGHYVSEIWVYDRGFGRFPAELHFRDGRLKRIEYLPRRSEQTE